VNMGAMPETLIENELFGREKGAFTGAMARQAGRFEIAHQGTLFLDEIGEMPLGVQVKLLRVLQTGELERLGSSTVIQVDVRIIAATNRDLMQRVRDGKFREDLYYRLNVFPITVPSLRHRTKDIPQLVWSFVQEFADRMGKPVERISTEAMSHLASHAWPGNIRELRNVIERSMILNTGPELRVLVPNPQASLSDLSPLPDDLRLDEIERQHIQRVLKMTGGRIRGPGGAAEKLGIKPSTLYSRMKKRNVIRP
jgi:formate hydrogenlyase transcriptional activator